MGRWRLAGAAKKVGQPLLGGRGRLTTAATRHRAIELIRRGECSRARPAEVPALKIRAAACCPVHCRLMGWRQIWLTGGHPPCLTLCKLGFHCRYLDLDACCRVTSSSCGVGRQFQGWWASFRVAALFLRAGLLRH